MKSKWHQENVPPGLIQTEISVSATQFISSQFIIFLSPTTNFLTYFISSTIE